MLYNTLYSYIISNDAEHNGDEIMKTISRNMIKGLAHMHSADVSIYDDGTFGIGGYPENRQSLINDLKNLGWRVNETDESGIKFKITGNKSAKEINFE